MVNRFSRETDGSVVNLRFDDGRMNVLSSEALRELADEVGNLPSKTKLLVFRSGHPGIFAAGADMREMAGFSGEEARDFSELGQSTFTMIERLTFPTAVLIDGDCFGGALDLTFSFDLRFSSRRSRFSHPGAKLGIVTGFGGTQKWRDIVSRPRATELFLSNRVVLAPAALEAGLVDQLFDDLYAEVKPVLSELTELSPARVAVTKELLRRAPSLSLSALTALGSHLERLYSGGLLNASD